MCTSLVAACVNVARMVTVLFVAEPPGEVGGVAVSVTVVDDAVNANAGTSVIVPVAVLSAKTAPLPDSVTVRVSAESTTASGVVCTVTVAVWGVLLSDQLDRVTDPLVTAV